MGKKNILEDLQASLEIDGSGANTRKWSNLIIENKIELLSIAPLINSERTIAMRFSWLIGTLCEMKPELVSPAVTFFFAQRDAVNFKGFKRSLAKMFWLAGVPGNIEGEAIHELFKWYQDPSLDVSTKSYCLSALFELCKKYPDLKNELFVITDDQLDKNTAAFKKRALKVMGSLQSI